MPLSVADIDWSQLAPGEAELLRDLVPRLEQGFSIAEIAAEDGVDERELELRWENLAAHVTALSGQITLPPLSDEELAALEQSIAEHGQRAPILRGSPSSGAPGKIVDGHHRLDICRRLGIEPWIVDVDGDAEWLRSLALVLNLARRQLSASARRGIIKAELLRDPTRSDRAVARFAGVSPTTVGTVRRELEQAGAVSKLDTRVGADGVEQPARKPQTRTPEPPTTKTIKVAVPVDLFEQRVGVWVSCRAFRLAERRPGIYELEVQLLDASAAGDEQVEAIQAHAAELAQRTNCSLSEAIAELLRTASTVFGREIPSLADLTYPEAEWLAARIPTMTLSEA